jgi:hypothetical protein
LSEKVKREREREVQSCGIPELMPVTLYFIPHGEITSVTSIALPLYQFDNLCDPCISDSSNNSFYFLSKKKTKKSRANVTKTAGRVERNHNRTTAGRCNINKTTPTRWCKEQRTAVTNVTKTAGRMEHNHNRTTAGRYI